MKYYVYIYLDRTKPGQYIYGDISFLYEPFYVGKGGNDRFKPYNHVTDKNELVSNKIKKLGYENIFIPIINCNSEFNAFGQEQYLIQLIGRRELQTGPLCNMTGGGEGGSKGPITREKLRQTHLGKKLSIEHRKKIGDACRGELNGFYGKKHSEQSLKKMSESHKKYKVWNIGINGYKNKPRTEKQKLAASIRVKEYNKTHIRQPISQETRNKMSASHKKRWAKKQQKDILL